MNHSLNDIFNATSKFLYTLSKEETYRIVAKEALILMRADHASVYLKRDKKLERVYTTLPKYAQTQIRKKGFTYKAFKERTVVIKNIKDFNRFHPEVESIGVEQVAFVALSYKNQAIGVLSLDFCSDIKITPEDKDVLKIFGSLASLAIRKTELYDEAKKAIKNRDLFISMAAHELKTPLTTINGYVDFLSSKAEGLNTNESIWIQELQFEVKRLTRLVQELLEVDQIEKNKLNIALREYLLLDVIEKATNNFIFSFPDRKLIFKNNLPKNDGIIICDPDKLLEALSNILENAAKYSPQNKEIILNIKATKSQFIISIRDQGQGISPEELPNIFKDFYRGTTDSQEGMGLGLYVTKKIIQGHKGDIKLHSKLNKGTTVEIKLPRYDKYIHHVELN